MNPRLEILGFKSFFLKMLTFSSYYLASSCRKKNSCVIRNSCFVCLTCYPTPVDPLPETCGIIHPRPPQLIFYNCRCAHLVRICLHSFYWGHFNIEIHVLHFWQYFQDFLLNNFFLCFFIFSFNIILAGYWI